MGRHSAPDDDPDEPAAGGVLVEEDGAAGRHSADAPAGPGAGETAGSVEDTNASLVDLLGGDDEAGGHVPPAAEPAVAAEPVPPPATRPRSGHSTRADLALIKTHGDVRARVLAGLVVPFVVCIAVLAAIGATGRTYLIWIAVTIFVAGVLVGVFLDAGHKRYPPTE